jgi:hypothetical protein
MTVYNYSNLVEPNGEVLKQEVVTYIEKDGKIQKIVVTRNFFDNDYVDTMENETIFVVK